MRNSFSLLFTTLLISVLSLNCGSHFESNPEEESTNSMQANDSQATTDDPLITFEEDGAPGTVLAEKRFFEVAGTSSNGNGCQDFGIESAMCPDNIRGLVTGGGLTSSRTNAFFISNQLINGFFSNKFSQTDNNPYAPLPISFTATPETETALFHAWSATDELYHVNAGLVRPTSSTQQVGQIRITVTPTTDNGIATFSIVLPNLSLSSGSSREYSTIVLKGPRVVFATSENFTPTNNNNIELWSFRIDDPNHVVTYRGFPISGTGSMGIGPLHGAILSDDGMRLLLVAQLGQAALNLQTMQTEFLATNWLHQNIGCRAYSGNGQVMAFTDAANLAAKIYKKNATTQQFDFYGSVNIPTIGPSNSCERAILSRTGDRMLVAARHTGFSSDHFTAYTLYVVDTTTSAPTILSNIYLPRTVSNSPTLDIMSAMDMNDAGTAFAVGFRGWHGINMPNLLNYRQTTGGNYVQSSSFLQENNNSVLFLDMNRVGNRLLAIFSYRMLTNAMSGGGISMVMNP